MELSAAEMALAASELVARERELSQLRWVPCRVKCCKRLLFPSPVRVQFTQGSGGCKGLLFRFGGGWTRVTHHATVPSLLVWSSCGGSAAVQCSHVWASGVVQVVPFLS